MPKDDKKFEVDGEVLESLPNTMFRVNLKTGKSILATPTGRMRRGFIRILPGDRVRVEMTQYDQDRGRIVFKY